MAKVMSADATGRTVQLNGVRISFGTSLKEAQMRKNAKPGDIPTHGVNFILERDHPKFAENKAVVVAALQAAAREFKRPEGWFQTLMEDEPKTCSLRKGEKFKNTAGEIYKGYEGNLIIVAKGPKGGKERPKKMLDRHKRPVETADINDVMYNGSYCDAVISFYGTDNGGTARLTCSVEAIRSLQIGERMGGGGIDVSDDDFDDVEDDDDAFADAGGTVAKSGGASIDDFL